MLNLAMLLELSARRDPGKVAVILDDIKLRYAELNGAANKIANGLVKSGIRPGEKVAIMLPNTPHFVMCYYAILKTGATVVPLNVLFKRHEVEYHLDDSDSVALIVWEGFLAEAAEGFKQATNCRTLIVAQAPSGRGEATLPLPEGALPLSALMADSAPIFDSVPDHARRYRGDSVHQRYHWPAQGRRAIAFQYVFQCDGRVPRSLARPRSPMMSRWWCCRSFTHSGRHVR